MAHDYIKKNIHDLQKLKQRDSRAFNPLEPGTQALRKPKLAHMKRPQGEITKDIA